MKSGGQWQGKHWIPNWRERLECPNCQMNNRQRLVTTLVKQILHNQPRKSVYLMEQVTPIFKWISETFTEHQIVGSEYLGFEYEGGTTLNGIRHEDAENMSFVVDKFDLILSNDVFEHVPNPAKAFAECARVLKPGGIMLATMPFHADQEISITRALVKNGKLENLLPAVYHGNPLSKDGSLVFTDFGWDVLDSIKSSGFSEVAIGIYGSEELGHLGGGQIIFEAKFRVNTKGIGVCE
jgi:SAM-dependent methyltransferase